MEALGIDIGGSGIKGAVIETASGEFVSERLRLETPQPATTLAVAGVVADLVREFGWDGPIGCGFPAVIDDGIVRTAANIDAGWVGTDVVALLEEATGCACTVLNDADAAGVAEMRFGAGSGRNGSVLILTLGTGIGSALFYQGKLFPNLELGFLPLKGGPAEHFTSAAIRKRDKLSWKSWSKRLNLFLSHVERLLTPELIIIGGGVSRRSEKFFPYLEARAELVPARLLNRAGIVGAACSAAEKQFAAACPVTF